MLVWMIHVNVRLTSGQIITFTEPAKQFPSDHMRLQILMIAG
jgi:hypothetical protein